MTLSNREFFDGLAQMWDSIIEVCPQKIEHILDVAQISPSDSVLDVGTGTGVLLSFLAERIGQDGKINAVDISKGMLDVAMRKFHSLSVVEFNQADVENDPIEGVFDHIIMYCVFPHLLFPEKTLEKLTRDNLHKGGNLVIAFPESKESINALGNHRSGKVHSRPLVAATQLSDQLAQRDLHVDYTEDTEDFYIIRITRNN